MRRAALVLAALVPAALALSALAPPPAHSYDPASQPPFGGEAVPPLEPVPRADPPPPGFELSPREAITIADHTEAVLAERLESPQVLAQAYTRGEGRWEVRYFAAGEVAGERTQVAQVHIEDASGAVLEAWRDHQVETKLARGYDGAVGRVVNSPWIWIPLCVLFVAPFVDPRRPFRLLHLDLLAIVALSVSLLFFNRGEITTSVPLVYPVLAYLFARMLILGAVGKRPHGSVVPLVPISWLVSGAVVLALGRIALNVVDSSVIDIGLAGVVGAERILDGQGLYGGVFAPGIDLRGDVYGPFNYLSYLPFVLVFPWDGTWNDVPAAHAAAIAFDVLTVLGLVALGRRLRAGAEGRALGVALAFAWLACPWTAYALNANTNDALVSALVVAALLALTSAPLRGAVVALGTAAKFGPAALAPLFAAGTGERRTWSTVLFAIAFVAVTLVLFLPFVPEGGPREIYDRTLGYQAGRSSPFSVWGLAPSLEPLQVVSRVFAVALGVAVFFWPRRRSAVQLAALAAAVLIATQVAVMHWFYFYVVWFLPLVLVAVFAAHERTSGRSGDLRPRSASPADPASAS